MHKEMPLVEPGNPLPLPFPIICLFINIAIFLLQDYMVKMEINSIRLDMKLVFEFTENVGSADISSSPSGDRTPKHGEVLNIYLF